MTKKQILKQLRLHLESLHKQQLLNLLDSWEGRTPRLWCEPNLKDCTECRFPEERICDEKDCDGRMIFDAKGEL